MNFSKLELIKPTIELKETFLKGLREFRDEKLPWAMDLDPDKLELDFESFVQKELQKKTWWTKDRPVDETELWGVIEGAYVGRISIRHKLNEDLKMMGGHIGYDTCPSFRRRGIANEMLKQALPIAKKLNLSKVMLTCNDDNLASIKVIEKNGGVLESKKSQHPGGPLKRYYWITLSIQ